MIAVRNTGILCFQCILCVLVALAWGIFLIRYFNLEVGYGATRYTPPPPPESALENAIAYVGADNHIWILQLDSPAQPPKRISNGSAQYVQPTWSPDGKWLAYIGAKNGQRNIYLNTINGDAQYTLYANRDARPFYLMWSSEGDRLGYLQSTQDKVELRHLLIRAPKSTHLSARASRVYFNWAPEGNRMITHADGELQLHGQNKDTVATLDIGLYRMQAPVWDAKRELTYFVRRRDTDYKNCLYRANTDFTAIEEVTELPGSCRMIISPDGQYLAFLGAREYSISTYWASHQGVAYIISTEEGKIHTLFEDEVVALFFSPDSKKIALLMRFWGYAKQPMQHFWNVESRYLDPETRSILMHQWVLYDIENDTLKPLYAFNSTRRFQGVLSYFDQYHNSHSFWSPDSRYLLTAEQDNDQNPRIWILDTEDEEAPRHVANGSFAVWSWQ